MGSCYVVTMGVKFKNKKGAVDALKRMIREHEASGKADFSIMKYAEQDIRPNGWDGLVRIFLAGWNGQEVQFGEWRKGVLHPKTEDGFFVYNNGFSASYGWESEMLDMFKTIAPYLKDGSWMNIDCDDGIDECIVTNGKFVQIK